MCENKLIGNVLTDQKMSEEVLIVSIFANSFCTLYSDDEFKRLTMLDMRNCTRIDVDVHGMTCHQAQQFISNIISLIRNPINMRVIHGYKHGTAISKMIREKYKNTRVIKRIAGTKNKGVTYLVISGTDQ